MPPIKRFYLFLLIVVKTMSAKAPLGGGATWHVASVLCYKGKRLYQTLSESPKDLELID